MSERNAQIVALVKDGEHHRSIARKFGISRARVGQIANAALGPKDPERRIRQEERTAIVDAARRGMCVRHIAGMVGRSHNGVRKVIKAAGVTAVNNRDVFGPDARALAVDLVRGGASYIEAAEATGMTKNAVIGACYRPGVSATKRSLSKS